MRAITFFRAFAWFGVVVVFWSLNVRWGSSTGLSSGPPTPWEKWTVAAGILALLVALSLSVSGRKGDPPSWMARGIAGGASLLAIGIVLYLRSKATGILADAATGPGWTWLAAGSGLILGAVIGTLGLKPQVRRPSKRRGRAGK